MSNLKTIAAIALLLALFACMVLVIPSIFVEEDNEETSGYSPISVNPPPENVSEPEQVSSPEELDSLSLTIDAIVNNIEAGHCFACTCGSVCCYVGKSKGYL